MFRKVIKITNNTEFSVCLSKDYCPFLNYDTHVIYVLKLIPITLLLILEVKLDNISFSLFFGGGGEIEGGCRVAIMVLKIVAGYAMFLLRKIMQIFQCCSIPEMTLIKH